MDEQNYHQIMAKTVDITCDQLTDVEVNTLYMATLLPGRNPKSLKFYEKVANLFTEDNGTRMHSTTVDALKVVWENRCEKRAR